MDIKGRSAPMMSTLLLLFKGIVAGFFYSFISISGVMYCTHYLLNKGKKRAMFAAYGIIAAQGIWALVASFILFILAKWTELNSPSFSIIGAMILFVMAIKFYKADVVFEEEEKLLQASPYKTFVEVFKLAMQSPIRIIGYAAIFAALGVVKYPVSFSNFISTTIGTLVGTYMWWQVFLTVLDKQKKALSPQNKQLLHRIAAFILIGFVVIGLLEVYL